MAGLERLYRDRPSLAVNNGRVLGEAEPDEGEARLRLEGQTFIIEYAGSGPMHMRAITVRNVRYNKAGQPLLGAICHESRQYKVFRCDRIESCADLDGEVRDTAAFLLDVIGLDITVAGAPSPVYQIAPAIRERARAPMVLLAALSLSDGYMRREERDVANAFLRTLLADAGLHDRQFNSLEKIFRTARPDRDMIMEAVEEVRQLPPETIMAFLQAAVRLVRADGVLMPEEIDMLNAIALDLIGVELQLT